mmetsp:Transcript_27758/g.26817  ORF Transcript_27758/g.26817 Transcript_27758/m.26817 type:complete len:96 (-) Transcript_27758:732-1019(-)
MGLIEQDFDLLDLLGLVTGRELALLDHVLGVFQELLNLVEICLLQLPQNPIQFSSELGELIPTHGAILLVVFHVGSEVCPELLPDVEAVLLVDGL